MLLAAITGLIYGGLFVALLGFSLALAKADKVSGMLIGAGAGLLGAVLLGCHQGPGRNRF